MYMGCICVCLHVCVCVFIVYCTGTTCVAAVLMRLLQLPVHIPVYILSAEDIRKTISGVNASPIARQYTL